MMNEDELKNLWMMQTAILYRQGATKEELLEKYGISVEYVFGFEAWMELHSNEIEELLKNSY